MRYQRGGLLYRFDERGFREQVDIDDLLSDVLEPVSEGKLVHLDGLEGLVVHAKSGRGVLRNRKFKKLSTIQFGVLKPRGPYRCSGPDPESEFVSFGGRFVIRRSTMISTASAV